MIATSQKTSLTSQKASSLGTWKPATTGVCRTKLQLSRARVVVKRRSLTEDWQRAVLCPAMDCYSSLVGREGAEVVVKQCPHCPAVDSTSIVVGREGVEVVVEGLGADCSLEGGEVAVVEQCPAVDSSIVVGREGVEVVVEGLAADCSLEGGEETERCGGGGEGVEVVVEGLAAECSLEGGEVAVVEQCPAVDSSIVVGREGVEVVVEGLAADCSLEGGEETERCGGGGEAWETLGFPPAELQTPILTRWTPTTILPSMPTPTP